MPMKQEQEILDRLERMEQAIFGDQNDRRSTGILSTITRLSAYLDAACWAWRAVIAGVAASASVFAFGRGLGWW